MSIMYGVVDSKGKPVLMTINDDYEIYHCKLDKLPLYNEPFIVESEIKNMKRIMRNDDYYNVWVSSDVELPLCVGQFEYVKELVKIL